MVRPAGTNSLWMLPFLSKKAINNILTLEFCRWLFFFGRELVEPGLISRDDVFQKQWILVTYGNEICRSFHPFYFLLVFELVRHKSGANLPFIQTIADDGMRRILANSQFLRNQSHLQSLILWQHLSHFVDHFWVLLVDGRPERGSSSVVRVPSWKRVNHSSKHFLLTASLLYTCTNMSRAPL